MKEKEPLLEKIVEGIIERKGKRIIVVDMSNLQDAPCSNFIICEGDSKVHVNAISDSIKDWVRKEEHIKASAIDGIENSEWIAMDYGSVIVHVFLRSVREFYDIEHLWEDAILTEIQNED